MVERNDEDNLLNQACLALQQTEDEDDVYGRSIAFTMRRITNPRNKAFAKMKIQEILFEAEFGQLGPFSPNVANQNFPQHQAMSYPPHVSSNPFQHKSQSHTNMSSPLSEESFLDL